LGRYLLAAVLLTLTYAFVLASFDPWDLTAGAALAAALLFAFGNSVFGDPAAPGEPASGRDRVRRPGLLRRGAAFGPLAVAAAWAIIEGTWEVTLVTLHLRKLDRPGLVAVPVGERTPTGVAVSALITTLSPGTFLVDVDEERGVMLIHTINAGDPEAVREAHQEFYRRYQGKVVP
jgi:multisubunit Na+/H+ antiporter MnhE subunit